MSLKNITLKDLKKLYHERYYRPFMDMLCYKYDPSESIKHREDIVDWLNCQSEYACDQSNGYIPALRCLILQCCLGSDSTTILNRLLSCIFPNITRFVIHRQRNLYRKRLASSMLRYVSVNWKSYPVSCLYLIVVLLRLASKIHIFKVVLATEIVNPAIGIELGRILLSPSLNFFSLKVILIFLLNTVLPVRHTTQGDPFVSVLWDSSADTALWKQFPFESDLGDLAVLRYLGLIDRILEEPAQEKFPMARKLIDSVIIKGNKQLKGGVYFDMLTPKNAVIWFPVKNNTTGLGKFCLVDLEDCDIILVNRQIHLFFTYNDPYDEEKECSMELTGGISSSWLCQHLQRMVPDSEASTDIEDEVLASTAGSSCTPVPVAILGAESSTADRRGTRANSREFSGACVSTGNVSKYSESNSTLGSTSFDSSGRSLSSHRTANQTTVDIDVDISDLQQQQMIDRVTGLRSLETSLTRQLQAAVASKASDISKLNSQVRESYLESYQSVAEAAEELKQWAIVQRSNRQDQRRKQRDAVPHNEEQILITWVRQNAWHRK